MIGILIFFIFGYAIWVFLARKLWLDYNYGYYDDGDILYCIIPALNIVVCFIMLGIRFINFDFKKYIIKFPTEKIIKIAQNIEEWFFKERSHL